MLYGVSVEFPPGALSDSEDITLGILSEASYLPDIAADPDTALVSPVVSCEPHRLELAKPVEMVLPHCARARNVSHIEEAWEFTTLMSDTRPGEAVNWQEATPTDFTIVEINDRNIRLKWHHFSKGSVKATRKKEQQAFKLVELIGFTTPSHNIAELFTISFLCIDDNLLEVRLPIKTPSG